MSSFWFWIFLKVGATTIVAYMTCHWFAGLGVGAPYLPVRKQDIEAGLALAGVQEGEVVVDLGSGDGRLLEVVAKKGGVVIGYEINPFMVWISRYRLRVFGSRAKIHRLNMFDADLSQADVVFIFQITKVMDRLTKKLVKELKPGARVITFAFELTHKQADERGGVAWLYRWPSTTRRSRATCHVNNGN